MSDPHFSRSGRTDPAGKLTARLDIPVSQETEEACIALAAMAGCPKAEYVRSIIERAVFGELLLVRRVARQVQSGPWDQSPAQDRVAG